MDQNYSEYYISKWEECSECMPEFKMVYSETEKFEKEEQLDQYLKMIKSLRRIRVNHKKENGFNEDSFFRKTRIFFSDGFGFTDKQLEVMFSDDLVAVTKTFVRQAHDFDPELNFSDIFQACRNVWIMNGLQLILEIPICLTPSIFAYSLLYPYTDNLIDDPQISAFEKWLFSEHLRDRLSGQKIQPSNKTENAIFQLIEMIENQYSRSNFPEVFESLLDIHAAQTNSLKLIQQKDSIQEKEILAICMNKGGASVLADGFLVAGKLTEEQKFFLFGYGAYLQLLDDVQDVDEDQRSGLMTIFSKSVAQIISLDKLLNKTYWFGEEVLKSLNKFEGQYINIFKSMMQKSTDLFLIEAIAQNTSAFTSNFVSEFETYSPFNFSFIRKRKENFISYHGFLLTALEEVAFAENNLTLLV